MVLQNYTLITMASILFLGTRWNWISLDFIFFFPFFPFNTSSEVELTANHLNYSRDITAFPNTAYLISVLCKFFNNYVFFCPPTQNELHSLTLCFFSTCLSCQINDTEVFFTPSLAFCRDAWLCLLLWDYFTCTLSVILMSVWLRLSLSTNKRKTLFCQLQKAVKQWFQMSW